MIIIPQGVAGELQHKNTPRQVKEWIQAAPDWLEIRSANTSLFIPQKQIGKGEHETIALALELNAAAVLIDDRGARQEALRANLFTPSRNSTNRRWNVTGKGKKPRSRKANHKNASVIGESKDE
jgi:hypothetical protein